MGSPPQGLSPTCLLYFGVGGWGRREVLGSKILAFLGGSLDGDPFR